MSVRNREIESKWEIFGAGLMEVNEYLHDILGHVVRKKIHGKSTDTYWPIPNPEVIGDFFRVRDLGDGKYQMTVKGKDRGSNENRLEIDIDTADASLHKLVRFGRALLGKPAGQITKEYYVYWPTQNEYTTISCYEIESPGETELVIRDDLQRDVVIVHRTFVEVETTSKEDLKKWEEIVVGGLSKEQIEVKRAPGSLFEMYIEEKKS